MACMDMQGTSQVSHTSDTRTFGSLLERVLGLQGNFIYKPSSPAPSHFIPTSMVLFRTAGDEIRAVLSPLPLSYSAPFSQRFAY